MWATITNALWGTKSDVDVEEEDGLESDSSQLGQSAELQPKQQRDAVPQPSATAQAEELKAFVDTVGRCEGYSQDVFMGFGTSPYGKGVRKQFKALKKLRAGATGEPSSVPNLSKRLVQVRSLEEDLVKMKVEVEQRAKEQAAAKLELQRQEALRTPVSVDSQEVLEKPQKVAEEAPKASWKEFVSTAKLPEWRRLAKSDPEAKQLLTKLKSEATARIELTGGKNKSKRQKSASTIRGIESGLDDRLEEEAKAIDAALIKPKLPGDLKTYAWNTFTGFKYPIGGELAIDGWKARITVSATKHPEDELGASPSEPRVTAYLKSFTAAATKFAKGIKSGNYVEQDTVTVDGWNLVGKKLNPQANANCRVEIYHADSGYEKGSPWRDESYLG